MELRLCDKDNGINNGQYGDGVQVIATGVRPDPRTTLSDGPEPRTAPSDGPEPRTALSDGPDPQRALSDGSDPRTALSDWTAQERYQARLVS